jgi:hypothetical protein
VISPDNPSEVTDKNNLEYWVRRCCDRGRTDIFHLTWQGVALTLHPARAAYLKLGGKQLLVKHDPKRHEGRGWLPNLIEDIEDAYRRLLAGRGKDVQKVFGDLIREEVERRAGVGRRLEGERESWIEWIEDDEMPLLMGSWSYHTGLVRGRFNVSRIDKVDFQLTNDEFDKAARLSHSNLFITLKRLARERMLRAGALKLDK